MNPEQALFIDKQVQRIRDERIQEALDQIQSEQMKQPKTYRLDISTIKDIEDVKNILEGLDLTISEDSDNYESVKRYFKEIT